MGKYEVGFDDRQQSLFIATGFESTTLLNLGFQNAETKIVAKSFG